MTGRMLTLDESITYDDYGNPLTYPFSRSFTWDGTRLASATDDGITKNFKYNANGELTVKYGGGSTTDYYWSEGKLIAEQVGALTYLYLYDAFGAPMGFQCRRSSDSVGEYEVYWFEKNLQGDIVAVYDNAGTKLISYVYDAWGNFEVEYHNGVNANHIAAKNPFRYRGYYYDTDLQFYYLKTRYYDPFACRFISPDRPDLLGANGDFNAYNLYAYCSNDPVNYVDPTGEFAWHILIGAIVGGVIGGISSAITGGDTWDIILGALSGMASGALTASGIGLAGQIFGNFAISAASNAIGQMIDIAIDETGDRKFDIGDMLMDGTISAIFAAWGGSGASYGNTAGINSSWTRLTKKGIFNKNARQYFYKTAHNAQRKFVLTSLTVGLSKSAVGSIVINIKNYVMG